MLSSGKMTGFLLTKDYDQARAFFEGKLGFDFVSLDQFALVMRAGENSIRIVKMTNFTPLQSSVLGWGVKDIEAAVGRRRKCAVCTPTLLSGRGVEFEKYPFVQDKERGIWTAPGGDRVAWFKDPDGNVLSVAQHTT